MDESARKAARSLIMNHESLRLRPYKDSLGFLSIGYGHCLELHSITANAASLILDDDIDWFVSAIEKNIPYFRDIDPVRQAVLLDMTFNLGLIGVMKFHDMWKAIQSGNWNAAADALLNSKWALQVGQRALDDARIMRMGKI